MNKAIQTATLCRVALSLAVVLCGCGGRVIPLEGTLPVPTVAGHTVSGADHGNKTELSVSLEELKDFRAAKYLVVNGDKTTLPDGDVLAAVRHGLEDTLTKNGISVSDASPLVLEVSLKTWNAEVTGSHTNASAEVGLKLYDPANKLIYSGRYSGQANLQKTKMLPEDYRDTLATALAEALSQIVRDERLVNLIASF